MLARCKLALDPVEVESEPSTRSAEANRPQPLCVGRPRTTGRLVVHKRVVDPNDPSRRFERRGFSFQILDATGQVVANSQFATDSTGRGICPVELNIGQPYTVQELSSPVPNVQLTNTPLTMERRNQQLRIVNQVTQPNTPYGG